MNRQDLEKDAALAGTEALSLYGKAKAWVQLHPEFALCIAAAIGGFIVAKLF